MGLEPLAEVQRALLVVEVLHLPHPQLGGLGLGNSLEHFSARKRAKIRTDNHDTSSSFAHYLSWMGLTELRRCYSYDVLRKKSIFGCKKHTGSGID